MLTRGGFQCRFSGLKNNGGVVRCGLWQRWVAGLALEHLVALGEAALRRGTIAEATDALEKKPRSAND